jgi:hypothetical protein
MTDNDNREATAITTGKATETTNPDNKQTGKQQPTERNDVKPMTTKRSEPDDNDNNQQPTNNRKRQK